MLGTGVGTTVGTRVGLKVLGRGVGDSDVGLRVDGAAEVGGFEQGQILATCCPLELYWYPQKRVHCVGPRVLGKGVGCAWVGHMVGAKAVREGRAEGLRDPRGVRALGVGDMLGVLAHSTP